MTQTPIRRTFIEVLKEDHREVEHMFGMAERASDAEEVKSLRDQIIAELVRHSVAEEQFLYPATRRHLPDGDELADHEIEEHAEAERTMKELEGIDPTDERFPPLLANLISEVRHHIEEEEGELFPRLERSMSAEEMEDLGSKIQQAKEVAPTRPHPSAPDTPPWNMILGPGTGLVDRVRDALSGRDV